MSTTLTGAWGRPVNTAANQKGGIHDDDTATELGFSGGTVAGSIHMEQFLPLLLQAFGDAWWHEGVISLYFMQATMDRQPVQCHLSFADEESRRATIWMENEDGDTIMSGTANLANCSEPTALEERLTDLRPAGELRILRDFAVGQTFNTNTRVAIDSVKRQLQVITESHDNFTNHEAFGQPALPYTEIVRAFNTVEQIAAEPAIQPFVGLYGGIQISYQAGPVLAETDYQATCKVVGLSDSPKTEILWRESELSLAGKPVARMLKMDRLMKNSSPLWAE